jgi:arylsulfatase
MSTADPNADPNILFILMDNLGYGEVGCYGGGLLRGAPTPKIDTLAREGTKCRHQHQQFAFPPARQPPLHSSARVDSVALRLW